MKRIAIIVVMVLMSLGASARSIHYFTYSQASRTVNYLNTQNELMLYCGYDYEIETYVLINEIWMERVNSSYYEIWLFGYDAYTGEEIYMPLDLQCVWLYSAGRMYNAAQYLRFRVEVRTPSIAWYVPPYNPYTRVKHRVGYARTYHYDIHHHGWMPPAHTPGSGRPPLHPYYMRRPNTPAPTPTNTWTPGTDRPSVPTPSTPYHIGNTTTATNPSANSSHSGSNTRNSTSTSSTQQATTTPSGSSTRNSSATSSSSTRNSSATSSSSSTRTRNNTSTSTTPTRSNTAPASATRTSTTTTTTSTPTRTTTTTTTTTPTRTRNTEANTTTRSSNTNNTSTRSSSTSSSRNSGTSTSSTRSSNTQTKTRTR